MISAYFVFCSLIFSEVQVQSSYFCTRFQKLNFGGQNPQQSIGKDVFKNETKNH